MTIAPSSNHARRSASDARGAMVDALAVGRRRAGGSRGGERGPGAAMLALQRAAGNSAVSALLAARMRGPGDAAIVEIDGALVELRRGEPDVERVERGLERAKAAGIPVDLEGTKPPASELAVRLTGFGPSAVAAKKPVPPPKPVPPISPLGKAAAAKRKAAGGRARGRTPRVPAAGAGGPAATRAPVNLAGDMLLRPPVPPPGVKPAEDPAFTRVRGNVKGFASAKRSHPSAASKADEAQAAAVAPSDDLAGQAKAAKADTMDAQRPGTFDRKAFIAAVKTAIEAKSPKTLKEADDYAKSGKAGEVKGEVKGLVTQGKDASVHDIEAATEAPPDSSKAVAKPVAPMAAEHPGQVVPIPAAGAVPKPAPPEQLNLEAGKREVDREMTDAGVTDAQLAKSGEPDFEGALAEKRTAAAHADSAPAEYRAGEQATLSQGRAQATAVTATGVQGMQGSKGAAIAGLVADKGRAKSEDERKRAEVTTRIQGIFTATETDVRKILDGIDPKVEKAFEQGEARARASFESYVAAKMSAYKRDRYGGWLGGLRWAKDKLVGMPAKVDEFYEAGRELYLTQMDGVISRVADIVGGDLIAAKQRIAKGRAEIASYVTSLPRDLRKVGSDAAAEIGDRFDQLESEVKDKENAVVDALATKYVEARKGLDERIEALQAENRGLVDKAIGAIKAVVNTIRQLAAMLRNALARAASVVGDIIGDPVGFLGNLISGIKGGIDRFFSNIATHLRKGLMGWLFGQLGDAGIELPDTFDLKGVVKLLASVFGLTWMNIRSRLVRQIGEKAMAAVEKGVEIFQVIREQGVAGLWDKLVEKIGDVKAMIMDQLQDFVITRIITAGITWLISLLNPAAAFIKACKLIYDVVMFFVNNAARIAQFVNTVIDGVVDIAKGNVSAVVAKIENALGQMVPILIGFIASVLGIGGIGEKIRSIMKSIQKPVNQALDAVIKTGLKLAAPIIRGLKGISTRVKAKVAAGKAWVKGKAESARDRLSGRRTGAEADHSGRLSPPAVKAKAREMLGGRRFTDADQARAALHAVWTELHPLGLKGLLLDPGSPSRAPAVLASASVAERIALSTSAAEVLSIALKMRMLFGTTTAFVTYGGATRFGPAGGFTNRGGHAELKIEERAPALLRRIERERRRGIFAAGAPVPIVIDMNRAPCDHCVPRMKRAFDDAIERGDVSVRINAASIWKDKYNGIDLTSDESLRALMSKGIEVAPLHVWPLIVRKLRELGDPEVQVGGRVYAIEEWLNLNAGSNGVGAFDVTEKLARVNAKPPVLPAIKVGAGSGS
ncbi:phage tail protein [Agromyces sp. ZXT2-6]|uniref:phage tail protein n=1 Tax=Agromyces sp. ZXT2-6 TaxID=3461153 RepID=UPI004054A126